MADPLDELDGRYAQLLVQIDELDQRIESVVAEHSAGKGASS